MSQPNPRKAILRNAAAPDPSDTSIMAANIPTHHPLPQHPHTHIPAHLKSSSRGGNHSKSSRSSAPEESPELKTLKAKFGKDKLATLKEIYPTWGDEDLLTTLSEAGGNVETAVTRIAEGHAEQWDSVSRKKDKKDKAGSAVGVGISPQQVARDRIESGGSASPGFRGGRGGRGGGPAAGGRGGMRGGRGGGRGGLITNGVGSGKVPLTFGAPAAPTPTAENGDSDPWGTAAATATDTGAWGSSTTDAKNGWGATPSNDAWGATPASVKEPANGSAAAPLHKEAPVAAKPTSRAPSQVVAKPVASSGPAKMSWAQIAKPKEKPPPPRVPAPAPAPATLPVPPAVQIPQESGGDTTASSEDAENALASSDEPDVSAIHTSEDAAEEALQEAATTAPLDDWIAVTPQNQPAVELPNVSAPEAALETEPAATEPEKAAEPEPEQQHLAPAEPTNLSSTSPISPPGLPALPAASQTPSVSSVSATPSIASTAPTSVPTKPSTPRLSSRAAARHKATDAPVVMPGGGLPTTVFGGLSFGNATFGGLDSGSRFGMQFGSLSLNDDLDASGPVENEEPVPEPAVVEPSPIVEAPAPVVQEREPTPPPPAPPVSVPPPQPIQQQQQSPRISTSSHINALFQSQQPSSQQQPQQVAAPQPSQAQHKVDPLPQFSGLHQGGAPGLLNHLQQQQQQQQQPQSLQHLQTHLPQPHQQLGGTSPTHGGAQQPQLPPPQSQQQQLSYGGGHQLAPHLDTSVTGPNHAAHPAVAAQSSYFRGSESPYGNFHAPTPSQPQLPHQLQQQQQQDHSSPYGAFSPLGQQGQAGVGQLGGFGASPAVGADYGGYDAQRGFYDSAYGQGSGFQNRGHEDATKPTLPPTNPSAGLPSQPSGGLGQVPPGPQSALAGQQAPFGMMPYHYFQQPYFHPGAGYNPYAQTNPYQQPKYPQYNQSPAGPGGPGPHQQQAAKPPNSAATTPYGSQHYPSQSTPYDDPSSVYPQQAGNAAADYAKQQQQPLYGGGANQLQNFFQQQQQQSAAGQSPGVGSGGQGQRGSGAASSSPENAYKPYNGAPGVGGAVDKSAQQQPQGRGGAAGGPGAQPQQQQGGFYPNRYSGQPQPASQGYPQTDGQQQFYPPYQQPGRYW